VMCLRLESSLSALHFRPEGSLLANNSGTRGQFPATPVMYGVEILTDYYFVLPQYTHLTDGQTDGRTNCDSNTVHCITCSCTVNIL